MDRNSSFGTADGAATVMSGAGSGGYGSGRGMYSGGNYSSSHASWHSSTDRFLPDGKLSGAVKESHEMRRKVTTNAFGRHDSIRSVMSLRRAPKLKLTHLTPEDIMKARAVYDAMPLPPLFTPFHITSLVMNYGMRNIPTCKEIEKTMLKTTQSITLNPSAAAAAIALDRPPTETPLTFDTFLEVLELLRRQHHRQLTREDETNEVFEALLNRYRHGGHLVRKGSNMTDEGSTGTTSKGRTAIPLSHLEGLVATAGVEYDFRSLLHAVDSSFDGSVTTSQFRWCAGSEDPTIVKAFVALGGEESLSGTIPVDTLINRCSAMGMTPQYIANFVAEIDINNDGLVDYGEFLAMIVRHKETKDLKRTWSAGGQKNVSLPRTSSAGRLSLASTQEGGGEAAAHQEGFNPFPRRQNFRRESQPTTEHRASFRPSPEESPNIKPQASFIDVDLDQADMHSEDTTSIERASSEGDDDSYSDLEEEEGMDFTTGTGFDGMDELAKTVMLGGPADSSVSRHHRRAGRGGFSIDLDGLIKRRHTGKVQEKTYVERIADVTARCKAVVAQQRHQTNRWLATEGTMPVKKIATERDGLVDVSTEKGRNQMKYYFGIKTRLPPKFAKVSPRLTAHNRLVAERLQLQAKLEADDDVKLEKEKKRPRRVPTRAVVAALLMAVGSAAAYLAYCTYEAPPALGEVDSEEGLLFRLVRGDRDGGRSSLPRPEGKKKLKPRKPAAAVVGCASTARRPPQRHLQGTRPKSSAGPPRGDSTNLQTALVEELNLQCVALDSLSAVAGPPPRFPHHHHHTPSPPSFATHHDDHHQKQEEPDEGDGTTTTAPGSRSVSSRPRTRTPGSRSAVDDVHSPPPVAVTMQL